MAEHRVRKDNIIYIIPDDGLFVKWKNDEAFIDDYGRLMNKKPHRVLRELKHYVENIPDEQQTVVTPTVPIRRNSSLVKDYLRDTVRDVTAEISDIIIDKAVDKFFYEVIPNVWREHIVPICHHTKEVITSKELKASAILAQNRTSVLETTKTKNGKNMTPEEAYAEKKKVLFHWIEMLNSLRKLQDAGEIDFNATLRQLTEPSMLSRINGILRENPDVLEPDEYVVLYELLGRNLYKEQHLVPIRTVEIETIAKKYGYGAGNNQMEDNRNG